MLARVSTELTTRAQLDAQGCDPMDCGVTSPPANSLAPQFEIKCTPTSHCSWSATVTISRHAYEGDNHAYHLAPGMYSTGLMQSGQNIAYYAQGPGNRQIYVEIDAAHSAASRDAEQGHCRDILHAFDITLKRVNDAVVAARDAGPFKGASASQAIGAAKDAIRTGLHPSLQAIIDECVNPVGVNNAMLGPKLVQLYLDTCQKTQSRDAMLWHTLKPHDEESWSAWSWLEYASSRLMPSSVHTAVLGDVKDIRKLVAGPRFSVNITPSAQVITL